MAKIDIKKMIKIPLVLCAIAGIGGLGIAATYVLTENTIETNRQEKERKAKDKVFAPLDASYDEENRIDIKNSPASMTYPYLVFCEDMSSTQGLTGRVYSASGSNSYGDIALLIGLTSDYSLYNIVIVENTESYAQTLTDYYFDPIMKAEDKDTAVTQVKCGATSGAKLVLSMVNQAKEHYREGAK